MTTIRLHQNRINPLVLPLIIAQKKGYFEKHLVKVDLRLADDFVFGGKSEFLTGEVDGMMGDTTFFFYYLEEGKKAVITSSLTRTIQLVGKNQLDDSRAIRVGVNRTGLFAFFLDTFLGTLFPKTEINFINNTYERMLALKEDRIDALVAIEPFVSQVLEDSEREVLWHSNELDGCFVMWCFDEEFVKNNPEDVRGFHRAIGEAAEEFNLLQPEKKVLLAQELGGYSPEIARSMADFHFENQEKYKEVDFNQCQEWMLENKEIGTSYSSNDKIFKTFE